MEPRATIVRTSDGSERVLLELADFQALLDAAAATTHGLPDVLSLVHQLRVVLGEHPDDVIDLDRFLVEYDALHGKG